MSITRINEFTAKEGQGDSLRDLLSKYGTAWKRIRRR
jgi:hypothetical protein